MKRRHFLSMTTAGALPQFVSAQEAGQQSASTTLSPDETARRLARNPAQLASQLASQYGQTMSAPVYTISFSVLGRILLGQSEQVQPLVRPFLNGKLDSLDKLSASHFSGHLVFAEWARRNPADRERSIALVRRAAEMALTQPLHNEMSDSVFMVCPLLAEAAVFTGERRFHEGAITHLHRMEQFCLRPDRLYRHSPLCEAAWGRGNAFPLLGLALAMSADQALVGTLKKPYVALAAKLAAHQDSDGMWHQVIDQSTSYAEYSATAMIARAMQRGISRKWLPQTFQKNVDRAWRAINLRTGLDGTVMGVCESTGKQRTLEDYYKRRAIFGRDDRGGAMGLLLATELAI